MTGTVVKNDASVAKVYFEGTSDTWEVTGKMKQEDLTNLVLQGFVVNGSREADNSTLQEDDTYSGTYFTANKETIFYGHQVQQSIIFIMLIRLIIFEIQI